MVAYGVVVLMGVVPPEEPVVALSVEPDGSLLLDWSYSDANSGGYDVCSSTTNPYFAPGVLGVSCVPEPGANYPISPAPSVNTYYAVRGINGVGQKSALEPGGPVPLHACTRVIRADRPECRVPPVCQATHRGFA